MRALLLALLFPVGMLNAQDLFYAKKVLGTLCSDYMAGRGYVKDGANRAATYIADEYKKSELKSFGSNYFQELGYPVVTFPNTVSISFDGVDLIPGEDYIVSPGCPSIKGVFDIVYVDSQTIDNTSLFKSFERSSFTRSLILLDVAPGAKLLHKERLDDIVKHKYNTRAILYMNTPKLTWSVSTELESFVVVRILKGVLKNIPKKVTIEIVPEMKNYLGNNVIGYIPGTKTPDSFVVFSAHYDHLGMMGPWAIFPGGNDNASGIAMMLDLMHYYKKNPPEYSVCFIAFTGEEAGLFGSYYYTQHPLFPLQKIAVLINMDLMGTGDKGMMVVNGTIFPEDFQVIQDINLEKNYLTGVQSRGKAQNSDHYFFSENGVKAFFFYLMGEYGAYHDVLDTEEAVTFSKYNEAFRLIRDYADFCMKPKK